jgi:hypothetical protein
VFARAVSLHLQGCGVESVGVYVYHFFEALGEVVGMDEFDSSGLGNGWMMQSAAVDVEGRPLCRSEMRVRGITRVAAREHWCSLICFANV